MFRKSYLSRPLQNYSLTTNKKKSTEYKHFKTLDFPVI